jgi:hypothetical protein
MIETIAMQALAASVFDNPSKRERRPLSLVP